MGEGEADVKNAMGEGEVDVKNYRLISNLTFMSKIVERLVCV